MDVEVLRKKDNPLLKRVEVTFKAVHKGEATPPRDTLRAELAKALKATKDVVVVDGAASTFGRYETHGYAKVYKTKEQALAVERRHILVRNRLAEPEAKPAEGAPKPEKPAPPPKKEETKPAAEKKPEPKAEAKPEKVAPREKAPVKEEKKPVKPEEKKPEVKKAEPKKPEPKKKEGK